MTTAIGSFFALFILLFGATDCNAQKAPIPLKTGNLSIEYMMKMARNEPPPPSPDQAAEVPKWRDWGMYSAEDFPTWFLVEPQEGKWDWSYFEANCAVQEKLGMSYGVYPWLHFMPEWYYTSERFVPLRCIEHNEPTNAPSLWGPDALWIYDRYYKALREHFQDRIKQIYFGMYSDFGEIGFPIGMASCIVPSPKILEHQHAGYWCGDKYARKAYKDFFIKKYGTLEKLNQAWGTSFATIDSIDYPKSEKSPRIYWLDFQAWYHDAMTDFTGRAIDTIRKHYPDTPLEILIGHGSEACIFGTDITGLVELAKKKQFKVRSTHAKFPYFWYKRIGGACKFYGVKFLNEPAYDVSRVEEVWRMFAEASIPCHEYKDFPFNIVAALDIFKAYHKFMTGEKPIVDVAFIYPSTDHNFHPYEAVPVNLWNLSNDAREVFDYDIIDERMIKDGVLGNYRILMIAEGKIFSQATLTKLSKWIKNGGKLFIAFSHDIESIEGNIFKPAAGKGLVKKWDGDMAKRKQFVDIVAKQVYKDSHQIPYVVRNGDFSWNGDGLSTTCFENHILIYNPTEQQKTMPVQLKKKEIKNVEIGPISIVKVDLVTGEVDAPKVEVKPLAK